MKNAKTTKTAARKSKKTTIIATVKEAAPALPAPAPSAPVAQNGQRDPNNKRITIGTPPTAWRVVRSQRTSFVGYFLQAGEYREERGQQRFYVGFEEKHADLAAAKSALAKRQSKPAAA